MALKCSVPGGETLLDVSVEERGVVVMMVVRCVCGVGGVSALIMLAVAILSECFPKWVMCRKRGSLSKATELDGIICVLM